MSPDFKDQRGFYLFLIIVPSSVMFEELLQMHDSARETRRHTANIYRGSPTSTVSTSTISTSTNFIAIGIKLVLVGD